MSDSSSRPFLMKFLQMESAGGIILMITAMLAIIIANSSFAPAYNLLFDTQVSVQIGELLIAKPLLLWVNDGLMAVFFFLVGLELKREILEGHLSDPRNIILPGIGAVGGMVIPALIYVAFNYQNADAVQGWAIPAATDIAFALGVLFLLGSRVPTALKVFLTSVAIFDDVGAIAVIAIFYTDNISLLSLVVVLGCLPVLAFFNWRGVESTSLYVLVGLVMWTAMLKSGVHATLAGILLAMFIPLRSKHKPEHSPLKTMEHDLHSVVAFFILPVFAFANAGINLEGVGVTQLLHPVPLGIALGLFIGKQVGVFLFCWAIIKLGLARLPAGVSWAALYGVSALCGIGFTMSLFIGSLAFEATQFDMVFDERLGIILGSIASGLLGFFILYFTLPKQAEATAST